jgi:hypothetical protein
VFGSAVFGHASVQSPQSLAWKPRGDGFTREMTGENSPDLSGNNPQRRRKRRTGNLENRKAGKAASRFPAFLLSDSPLHPALVPRAPCLLVSRPFLNAFEPRPPGLGSVL